MAHADRNASVTRRSGRDCFAADWLGSGISADGPIADLAIEMHYPLGMRKMWLLFALMSLVAAAIIWAFAAAWVGKVVFLPDVAMLRSGEWFGWVFVVTLMYGPLALAGWMIVKAVQNDS